MAGQTSEGCPQTHAHDVETFSRTKAIRVVSNMPPGTLSQPGPQQDFCQPANNSRSGGCRRCKARSATGSHEEEVVTAASATQATVQLLQTPLMEEARQEVLSWAPTSKLAQGFAGGPTSRLQSRAVTRSAT